VTAQALANEFEVSLRTVYRDIDELSASGIPVYGDRGPGGGFQLIEGYRTQLTGLTAGEAETLLLAGLPGPAADLGLAEPLAMARLKVLAAISPAASKAAERIGDRLHIDPFPWYRRAEPSEHLRAIARALWGDRRLDIRYENWSAKVRRKVDPLGLVLKAGSWYLVARVGRDIRTYNTANVLHLSALNETFAYPAEFDLASHWHGAVARFEGSLKKVKVTLRVSLTALSRLDRLGTDIEEAILQAKPDASGWRRATILVESIDRAAGLLLGFSDEIEVLAPSALRVQLATRARRVTSLYKSRRVDRAAND
jgi:predicted DNA-binding transcriptional regulator YafY